MRCHPPEPGRAESGSRSLGPRMPCRREFRGLLNCHHDPTAGCCSLPSDDSLNLADIGRPQHDGNASEKNRSQ
ncbi:hypothetical protein CPAR01_15858 [Colletotrichum paranaense]|uniref:Uncharacterized protein n=1 Tax=Colletotrichum paranaense TaxID=1914294 RepID=A0ABQ9RY13_9PEZI|nr:uncharacterized protein CPAR01_15858 [Colletotrichum paranaense]KAK1518209.1 hypothetical protein CPAR01_15858 [Colletotrichum paranaense]